MASWRISVILLALGSFLLVAAGTAWTNDHGADPAHHAAAMISDHASDGQHAIQADDDCLGMACLALHCAFCAAVGPSEAPETQFPVDAALVRVFSADGLQGRSVAPPTAPPKSA
jgi:hypothetical protein